MALPDDKDFARALRAEDDAQKQAGMPDAADRAIRQKLKAPRARSKAPLYLVAAAAVALLLFVFWPSAAPPVDPQIGPWVVRAGIATEAGCDGASEIGVNREQSRGHEGANPERLDLA